MWESPRYNKDQTKGHAQKKEEEEFSKTNNEVNNSNKADKRSVIDGVWG